MAPPPDDAHVSATGLAEARAHLTALEARLRDMTPVLKVVAAEIDLRTDNAFAQSKSPAGDAFAPLAKSTLEARARRSSAGARRRQKNAPHRLTKGAKAKREKFVATGNAKPMIDTARARKSAHSRVIGQTIQWSGVGYLGPSIVGAHNGRPPKRNVSVFELRGNEWFLEPRMALYMNERIRSYVQTGALR